MSADGAEAPAPITVVGLGPAGPEYLTGAAREALSATGRAFLRTHRHPSAAGYAELASFDHHYQQAQSFDDVYARVVEDLVAAAHHSQEAGDPPVVYAVPGSPLVAERTVELLRSDGRVAVTVVPAVSFLDLAWSALDVDPLAAGVRLVDGTRFAHEGAGERGPLLVGQCWSAEVLSAIKLSLDTDRPEPASPVVVLHHLGLPDQRVTEVDWWELDRRIEPDHLTSLWIPELHAPVAGELVALGELVRTLRRECPWDREQTHASLARHLLEESYEVLDAIAALPGPATTRPARLTAPAVGADRRDQTAGGTAPEGQTVGDPGIEHFREELGDLLFQVFFHAGLASEEGWFTLADVARGVHDKLVFRHPHVFADVVAETPDAVAANWELLKKKEKGRRSVTEGVPRALPALALTATLQRKADGAGLVVPAGGAESVVPAGGTESVVPAGGAESVVPAGGAESVVPAGGADRSPAGAVAALRATVSTLGAVLGHDRTGDGDSTDDRSRFVGDMLFAAVRLARAVGVDPEEALRATALTFAEGVRRAEARAAGSP